MGTGAVTPTPTSSTSHEVFVTKPKPLLRGWSHALAAVGSVGLTIGLLWRTANDLPKLLSMLVFGLSMVEMYAVSAVYHMGNWRPRVHRVLRAIDHSNIFVLIAGSYTPLAFNTFTGWWRIAILSAVWAVAFVGVFLAVFKPRISRWVGSALYVGMGWIALAALPEMLSVLPGPPLYVLLAGGILYTVGAVIYALKKPNPFPRVFGFHEIFHLFVIAGSVAIAAVIWVWVVPYPRM